MRVSDTPLSSEKQVILIFLGDGTTSVAMLARDYHSNLAESRDGGSKEARSCRPFVAETPHGSRPRRATGSCCRSSTCSRYGYTHAPRIPTLLAPLLPHRRCYYPTIRLCRRPVSSRTRRTPSISHCVPTRPSSSSSTLSAISPWIPTSPPPIDRPASRRGLRHILSRPPPRPP